MAITSLKEIWNGRDCKRNSEGKRTYMRTYRAISDNASESAKAVCEASGLPLMGDTYLVGTDADTSASVVDIDARQDTSDRKVWTIEVSYSTDEPDDGGQDEHGNPTDDPVTERSKIRAQLAQFTGKIYKQAEDPLPGESTAAWLGKGKAFLNSAMQPYRPPFREVDRSDLVITITRNQAAFNASTADECKDTVNSGVWGISYQGFTVSCGPRTAKMQNISCGDFQRKHGIGYREVTYEIHVRREGWHDEVLDEGTTITVPPAMASTWAANPANAGILALTDPNGQPVPVPVLLKNGAPLPNGHDPQFIRWHKYEEKIFNGLGLP